MQEYFAKEVGTGLAGGALSGGTFGFGRGLMEGENPFKTAAQDAAIGLALGGATGYGAGKIGKQFAKRNLYNNAGNEQIANKYYDNYIDGLNDYQNDWREFNRLKMGDNYGGSGQLFDNSDDLYNDLSKKLTEHYNIPVENFTPEQTKEYRDAGEQFYKKYINGVLNKPDYGDIHFYNQQIGKDALHNLEVYPSLREQILNAEVGTPTFDKIEKRTDGIKQFDHLLNKFNGKDMDYLIGIDDHGKKYYMTKDISENPVIHREQPPTSNRTSDTIIPDAAAKINPEPLSNIPTNNDGYSVKLRRIQRPSFNMEQALKHGYYPVNSVEQTLPLNTEEGKALKELLNKNWELKQNYKVDYIDPHSGYWNKRTGKMDLGYPRYFDTKEEAEKFAQTVQEPLINLVKEWHHYYGGGKDYLLNIQKLKDAGFNIDTSTANKDFYLKSILGGIGLAELLKRQSALYDGLTQQ